MIIAFTGPSSLTDDQKVAVAEGLSETHQIGATVWRSGCAFGVDSMAARFADAFEIDLELYVPRDWHNERLVRKLKEKAARLTYYNSYRSRNEAMVEGANLLVAFLKSEVFYRSGEWMTVNIARDLGVEVTIYII